MDGSAPHSAGAPVTSLPRHAAAQQANTCLTKAGDLVDNLTRLQAAIAKGDWPLVARLAEDADQRVAVIGGYAYALKIQTRRIEHEAAR